MDLNLDLGPPRFGNEDVVLPDAEAFPEMIRQVPIMAEPIRSSSEALEEDSSSMSADALLRPKRRAPKALPYDKTPELRNADLVSWNENYVRNMADDVQTKMQHRVPKVSKRNAAFWVKGSGIGGIGYVIKSSGLKNPLDKFAGDTLMETLMGVVASFAGRKRHHDEEEDRVFGSGERRVRMRDDDDQLGPMNELITNEDEGLAIPGEDVSLFIICFCPSANFALGNRDRPRGPGSTRRSVIPMECHNIGGWITPRLRGTRL